MEHSEQADRRRIVNLLTALVALSSALVVALAIGSIVLWREYRQLRTAVATAVGDQGVSVHDVVEEISRRQAAVSSQLATQGKETARQVADFERRAAEIREKGGGPIDSVKKAAEIADLMLDQSLLALKQTATLQQVLQRSTGPLAAQRELLQAERDEPDEAAPRSARRPPGSSKAGSEPASGGR